jgi:Rrf2 family protein
VAGIAGPGFRSPGLCYFPGVRATQQLKYAIYGVFDLAYNGGVRPTRIQEIGARQGIPARYLEQIFQRLRRAGLVESKRGPGGGYMLGRAPDAITLADLAIAVEGSVLSGAYDGTGAESPEFIWELLRGRLEQTLAAITVAALCQEAARRGVQRAESEPAMYHI